MHQTHDGNEDACRRACCDCVLELMSSLVSVMAAMCDDAAEVEGPTNQELPRFASDVCTCVSDANRVCPMSDFFSKGPGPEVSSDETA